MIATFLLKFSLGFPVLAGYQACPLDLKAHQDVYLALRKLEGMHLVGDCKIEIHSCDDKTPQGADAQLADLLVTKDGQEYYLPIYLSQNSSQSTSELNLDGSKIIFKFRDENPDPYSGNKEQSVLRIETRESDPKRIHSFSLAVKDKNNYSKFLFMRFAKSIRCSD